MSYAAHNELLGEMNFFGHTLCNSAKRKVAFPGTRNVGHTSGPVSQNVGRPKGYPGVLVITARTKTQGDATAWEAGITPVGVWKQAQRKGLLQYLAAGRISFASLCLLTGKQKSRGG